MAPLTVGLIGGGVVGGGCVEIFHDHADIRVKTVVVSDTSKPRDYKTKGIHFTTDPMEVVTDPEIDVVVDVMGGVELAWEIMQKAFENGKHLVSANKACLATKLKELDRYFEKENHRDRMLFFEAAVAGGVPIIAIVKRSLATDKITRIGGILNGTTNYMLSAMYEEGLDYGEILKSAQELGYAEADPTADVGGHDARHKLMLLARLAFGVSFTNDEIPTQGITEISSEDFVYAKMLNCTIKLIAEAQMTEENGKRVVRGFVAPVFVPTTSNLGTCKGVLNEVEVVTEHLGPIYAKGPGAGRFPTANSVVSDILECRTLHEASGSSKIYPHPFNRCLMPESQCDTDQRVLDQMFYCRLIIKDQTGIIADLATILAKFDVSIHAIHQTPITDHNRVTFCIITEKTSSFNMNHVMTAIKDRPYMLENPFYCPFRGFDAQTN